MKNKIPGLYIWTPIIGIAVLILVLISATKVYLDKTVEILIGLLSFFGTAWLGLITLYQNHVFKTYAEENDRKKREQDLIIQTTPHVFFYGARSAFFVDFLVKKGENVLSLNRKVGYIGDYLDFDLLLKCDPKNQLTSIMYKRARVELYKEEAEDKHRYDFVESYKLLNHDMIGGGVQLFNEGEYVSRLKLCLDKDFYELASQNNLLTLTLVYQVENLFNVSYEGEIQISFDINCEQKGKEWHQVLEDNTFEVRTNKIYKKPYVKKSICNINVL